MSLGEVWVICAYLPMCSFMHYILLVWAEAHQVYHSWVLIIVWIMPSEP